MKNVIVALALLVSTSVHATVDACSNELESRIKFAYNEGGLTITNLVGPIRWNEGTENDGLALKVAYAVAYKNDPQVNPESTVGNVLVIAECTHDEPSTAIDKNNDGEFTLLDTVTLGQ